VYSLFARLRQLILPSSALPDDSAVVIGPDLPPCMQAAYSSAIFFRPQNTFTGGVNAAPLYFLAQKKITGVFQNVDEGWALYDGNTICGYVVMSTRLALNNGAGVLTIGQTWEAKAPVGAVSLFGGNGASFQFGSTNPASPATNLSIGSATVSPSKGDLIIDGVSAGRGLRAQISSTASSAAIGAEAVVLTTPVFTAFNNRAYKWKILGHLVGSVAPANANAQVRLVNLAGAVLGFVSVPMAAAGPFYSCAFEGYFKRTAGTDLVGTNLVQTIFTSAGTVTAFGGATGVRSLEVYDAGAAADFPNAITI